LRGRPLESNFENKMLLFNELMVTIYLYVLISLTDYNDDADLFDNCGIALLTIVLIAFAVNFIKFLYFLLQDAYKRLKAKCYKRGNNKGENYQPS
jgi:Kef-type K+ transport system membrane component KefB